MKFFQIYRYDDVEMGRGFGRHVEYIVAEDIDAALDQYSDDFWYEHAIRPVTRDNISDHLWMLQEEITKMQTLLETVE